MKLNNLALGLAICFLAVATVTAQDPKPGEQVDCVFTCEIDGEKRELKYDLFVPAQYASEKNQKFPLMLFLHGAGERGDDLKKVRTWGPPKIVQKKKDFPFIVISPQCKRGSWWTKEVDALARLVDEIAGKLRVNNKKMYCTGLSMGGYGTWALCAKHPKLFAAAAPICGGGKPETADQLTKLPMWVFHGDADRVVKLDQSKKMVDAIKAAGGEYIKFTVYEGVGHNSWSNAYATKELYQWMLSHSRGKPGVKSEK